jgi:hypothetical protein
MLPLTWRTSKAMAVQMYPVIVSAKVLSNKEVTLSAFGIGSHRLVSIPFAKSVQFESGPLQGVDQRRLLLQLRG